MLWLKKMNKILILFFNFVGNDTINGPLCQLNYWQEVK